MFRTAQRQRDTIAKVLKRAHTPLYLEDVVKRAKLDDRTVERRLQEMQRAGAVESFVVWQLAPAEPGGGS